jgi:hypothetical protein
MLDLTPIHQANSSLETLTGRTRESHGSRSPNTAFEAVKNNRNRPVFQALTSPPAGTTA